jgi:hypothetical protein
MKDATAAIGRIAEIGYLNFEGDREQKAGVDLRMEELLMIGITMCYEIYCRTFWS